MEQLFWGAILAALVVFGLFLAGRLDRFFAEQPRAVRRIRAVRLPRALFRRRVHPH